MPASSVPPELIQAHQLLKAAERGQAAKVLKAYLSKNPRDANAWWLMAHAVTKPDNVRTCLERVIALNPDHAKARAKLDEMAVPPVEEEPDDSFFGVSSEDRANAAAASAPSAAPDASTGPHPFLPTPLQGMQPSEEPPAVAVPLVADPFADLPPSTPGFNPASTANPFTADIPEASHPPAPLASSTHPAAPETGWNFSFTGDVPSAPAPEARPAQTPPPAASGAAQSPFLMDGGEPDWMARLDGTSFDGGFASAEPAPAASFDGGFSPADPATAASFDASAAAPGGDEPGWLAQFNASDLRAPLGTAPDDDPFAVASAWAAEDSAPPVEPVAPAAQSAPADPFAASNWTAAPVADTPASDPDVPDWAARAEQSAPADPFAVSNWTAAPVADTPASDPDVPDWATVLANTLPDPPAEPAAPAAQSAPADPFAASNWTAPVTGTPPAPKPNPIPAPAAPPPPRPAAPRTAPAHDPFAGVVGSGDPFADLPSHPGVPIAGSSSLPRRPAEPPKTPAAPPPEDVNKRVRRVMMIMVAAVVVVVLVGVVWYIADQRGMFEPPLPDMTRLDAASFTIEYPEGWDMRCTTESLGYPVCGIANDKFYNQVDYFAGHDVDFAQMFADLGNDLLFGASDLPDTQVSVVIMDVTRSSSAYEGYSQAKSVYELAQQEVGVSTDAKVTYDQHEMTIDGRTANYYHLDVRDPGAYNTRVFGREAIYDVYIEHDGRVLWMTVSMTGPLKADLPADVIEAMIQSIHIKSAGE